MKNEQKWRAAAMVGLVAVAAIFFASCNKADDPFSGETLQTANNDATTESQLNETEDMSTNALTTADTPGGRADASLADDRFKCATFKFDSAANRVSGKVTIDFGTGCTDSKGNVRKGKIIVTWSGGRWYKAGSTIVINYSGYSINDVSFSDNDVRTIVNISSGASPLTWRVEASHNLTWPDGSVATRQVHHTRQWVRTATIVDDKIIVSQTVGAANAASGTNRHGVGYSVQITTPLEYSRACAISNKVFRPVKGVRVITYDTNKVVTIDFGNGTCDNSFTISANGHTRTVNAKNDSSAD
jgi:hypothetical protein